MTNFNNDFNTFFIELAANNHKDWFDKNRDRYKNAIKIPFENFISEVITKIQKEEPTFKVDGRKAIFRINRDIRFAKDKSPYKLNRSAFLSPYGKKDNRPGLYISLGPEKVMIGGGVYSPEKSELMKVRNAIASDLKGFEKAINDPKFKKVYGTLLGAENKRLPTKELTAAAHNQPLLLKKQFFYMVELLPETVTNPNLVQQVVDYYKAATPVRQFFERALS